MIIIFIVFSTLLILSAFFSGSETAIFSLGILDRTKISKDKRKSARTFVSLYSDSHKLLSTILIGNMVVNIAFSSVMSRFFGAEQFLAIVVITVVLLIFGEITPKNIALSFNCKIALLIAAPLNFFSWFFTPVRKLLDYLTRPVVGRISGEEENKTVITTEELKAAVRSGYGKGLVDSDETTLLYNVLNFSIKQARHIMTPRLRLKLLSASSSIDDTIKFAKKNRLSKILIYKKTKDNIIGYIRVKDLLPYLRGIKKANRITHLVLPVFYIPERKPLADFLPELKESLSRIAVIVDEFGGTAGIITLDDIVEEIMGTLSEEGDVEKKDCWIDKRGTHFKGSTSLGFFSKKMSWELQSDDYETLSGYVLELAGDLPMQGDSFEDSKFSYTIEKMVKNRIELIGVNKK